MRIAVLSDIHDNVWKLDAALAGKPKDSLGVVVAVACRIDVEGSTWSLTTRKEAESANNGPEPRP